MNNKLKKLRDAAGFTLIELIVVIAILGVLGGVAVPVYKGYVEKANTVADNELLGAINTAYAAACLANGVDMAQVANAHGSAEQHTGQGADGHLRRAVDGNAGRNVPAKLDNAQILHDKCIHAAEGGFPNERANFSGLPIGNQSV